MYCLDANVWIYYFDTALDEHDSVVSAVTPLLADEPLFTTTVLQMEVVHYLHSQFDDPQPRTDQFLGLENVLVADLCEQDVEHAVELLREHPHAGIGGRDATVLASMQRHDVSRLWTHDTGLKRVAAQLDWLDGTDPVELESA